MHDILDSKVQEHSTFKAYAEEVASGKVWEGCCCNYRYYLAVAVAAAAAATTTTTAQ